jgi:hypothetical protein
MVDSPISYFRFQAAAVRTLRLVISCVVCFLSAINRTVFLFASSSRKTSMTTNVSPRASWPPRLFRGLLNAPVRRLHSSNPTNCWQCQIVTFRWYHSKTSGPWLCKARPRNGTRVSCSKHSITLDGPRIFVHTTCPESIPVDLSSS